MMNSFQAWRRLVSTVLCLQVCAVGLVEPVAAAKKSVAAPVSHPHHTLTPYLVMDVASGRIIEERIASHIWYPASVTKLMTVFVALDAVRQGRLTMDTPLEVTSRAARMKPSKMGFPPGAQVTLDNALKMLMVKSANDIAVTVAEGVSGSVEAFADEMNQTAATLGMRESHFVNPNGLPDPNHISSARDMAILGRALLLRFPEHADLFNIGAFRLGDKIVPTHNGMIGRYPGADGMKTGFTCPAGFNLVASATREGRKVIVVVMGDASARQRTAHAADLFDRAFSSSQLGDFAANLPSIAGEPPDMKSEVCVRRSKAAQTEAETEDLSVPINTPDGPASAPQPGNGMLIAALPRPIYEPISVFVGPAPGYQGPVAGPRPANTPIGVIAYASPEKAAIVAPLRPDPKALSMRRGAKPKPAVKSANKSETKAAPRSVKPGPDKVTKKTTETKAHPTKPSGKAAIN
jgi:D-alanyl-D-alanine carboxypeptidase